MQINELIIGKTYAQQELREIFGGSFYGGMNICHKTNSLVLISKHYGNLKYKDEWKDGVLYYTGMGQIGDQTMSMGNKALQDAKSNSVTVFLFEDFKPTEHKYFGKVSLFKSPYQDREFDIHENDRFVWKFPLKLLEDGKTQLSEEEMADVIAGGTIKPSYDVVCAVIFQGNKVLCAQRGYGSLKGKWEFPGGKIENGETKEQALVREVQEELNIVVAVKNHFENSYYEYDDRIVNLSAYQCEIVSGKIVNKEHTSLKWLNRDEISTLDWADADIPLADKVMESLPIKIDGDPVKFDYYETKPVGKKMSDSKRALIDYEKAERAKRKSGDKAEDAVIQYEIDRLLESGRPDLALKVISRSKSSNDYGYDVLSFESIDNLDVEKHIEVKKANYSGNYLTFFISANELKHFKNDPYFRIYCLFASGKVFKLHEVNKTEFRDDYLTPLSYQVRIRISEY